MIRRDYRVKPGQGLRADWGKLSEESLGRVHTPCSIERNVRERLVLIEMQLRSKLGMIAYGGANLNGTLGECPMPPVLSGTITYQT